MDEVLFSNKKKWNTDEHWKHHAKWKKPVTKDHICVIPFICNSRIGNSIDTESRLVVS